MSSSLSHNTLVHFRFNPEHKAQRGGHGLGSNCSGYAGEPTTLKVPVGTLLYDDETGELIHDFARPNETIVIARGGRGGRGNQHFATSTHQAPREHELGRAGEERNYRLELRLLADAGLVGYPNVGKSTLISRLSAARPKIANYAFTTLEPNLGVVQVGDYPHTESFTVADLPGLIEGAHLGAGLGIQFLKHIERTSVIVHLVDVSDSSAAASKAVPAPTPSHDFKVITDELKSLRPRARRQAHHPRRRKGRRRQSRQAQKARRLRQAPQAALLRHLRRHRRRHRRPQVRHRRDGRRPPPHRPRTRSSRTREAQTRLRATRSKRKRPRPLS